jgi:hypothetical protein
MTTCRAEGQQLEVIKSEDFGFWLKMPPKKKKGKGKKKKKKDGNDMDILYAIL